MQATPQRMLAATFEAIETWLGVLPAVSSAAAVRTSFQFGASSIYVYGIGELSNHTNIYSSMEDVHVGRSCVFLSAAC